MILRTITIYLAQLNISPLPKSGTGDDARNAWQVGLIIVAGIMAVVAVLMIVVNGLLYITSNGEPQKIAQARMGILYSVIGLIIVLLATTIVNFAIRGIS